MDEDVDGCAHTRHDSSWESVFIEKDRNSHNVAYREDASDRTQPSSTHLEEKRCESIPVVYRRFVVENAPEKNIQVNVNGRFQSCKTLFEE